MVNKARTYAKSDIVFNLNGLRVIGDMVDILDTVKLWKTKSP